MKHLQIVILYPLLCKKSLNVVLTIVIASAPNDFVCLNHKK